MMAEGASPTIQGSPRPAILVRLRTDQSEPGASFFFLVQKGLCIAIKLIGRRGVHATTTQQQVRQLSMSVFAVASLRAIPGRCLQQPTTGLLSVHIGSRSSGAHIRAIVSLPPSWQRYQSTGAGDAAQKPTSQSKPQKVTFRQFAGRALGAGLRNLAFALSPRGIKQAYKDSPGSTSFAVVL